jgi:hypothetical protein
MTGEPYGKEAAMRGAGLPVDDTDASTDSKDPLNIRRV